MQFFSVFGVLRILKGLFAQMLLFSRSYRRFLTLISRFLVSKNLVTLVESLQGWFRTTVIFLVLSSRRAPLHHRPPLQLFDGVRPVREEAEEQGLLLLLRLAAEVREKNKDETVSGPAGGLHGQKKSTFISSRAEEEQEWEEEKRNSVRNYMTWYLGRRYKLQKDETWNCHMFIHFVS